jgi:ketosteroid isomerase-like protein
MSQENVEIIKAAIAAYNRGDWDGVLKDVVANFELDLSRSIGPQRGIYGLSVVRRFWAEWDGAFEFVQLDADEFIEAGDYVAVPSTMRIRGRDGVEAAASAAWVCTLRDGAIERITMYQDKSSALEAVGLSE